TPSCWCSSRPVSSSRSRPVRRLRCLSSRRAFWDRSKRRSRRSSSGHADTSLRENHVSRRDSQGHERGAATIYFLLLTSVLFGLVVMATDFGRLYVVQGELQTAADAAALASALRLVGTTNAPLQASDQMTASFDSTTGNDNRFN